MSWEGYAVTIAFFLGLGLLKLVADPIRRSIAMALVVAAFGAVVILTWENSGAEVRRGWREMLWNRQTLVWLGVWLVFAAAAMVAGYQACSGCSHPPGSSR